MATLLHLLSLQHQNPSMATPFNPDKQHTIGSSVIISGTGLHTGILADLTLHAANPGYGIQFKRTDLPDQPVIKADCDLVTDTNHRLPIERKAEA